MLDSLECPLSKNCIMINKECPEIDFYDCPHFNRYEAYVQSLVSDRKYKPVETPDFKGYLK